MLADISRLSETLLSLVVVVSVATLGAVWRIGTIIARIGATQSAHDTRLARLEAHEDAHDCWHLARGDR